ncbi:hypothetical protein D3C86_1925200 [compost metagenome]
MDENPRPDSAEVTDCSIYTTQLPDSDTIADLDEWIYMRTSFDDGIVSNTGAAADSNKSM